MGDPELWYGLGTYRLDRLDRDGRTEISECYGAFLAGRLFIWNKVHGNHQICRSNEGLEQGTRR